MLRVKSGNARYSFLSAFHYRFLLVQQEGEIDKDPLRTRLIIRCPRRHPKRMMTIGRQGTAWDVGTWLVSYPELVLDLILVLRGL